MPITANTICVNRPDVPVKYSLICAILCFVLGLSFFAY
jgi:hypothetical protein